MDHTADTRSYLETLTEKHAAFEAEIDAERRRPAPDNVRLSDLKRRKLAVKDEIARLSALAPGA